jgi:hypothetical protein
MAYFDVPVLLSYRLALSDNMQLHLNAGPFVGFGAFGTTSANYDGDAYSEDTFGEETFSRLDAGISLGAGVSVGKIYFGLKYDLGMINILKEAEEGFYVHSRVFGITVGLNF